MRSSAMRASILLAAFIGLADCGVPFIRLHSTPPPIPPLSQTPANPSSPPAATAVHFVLHQLVGAEIVRPRLIADSTSTWPGLLAPHDSLEPEQRGSSDVLPKEWPDSLHQAFAEAWSDYRAQNRHPRLLPSEALAGLGVSLGPVPRPECTGAKPKNCQLPPPFLFVSWPGMSADSLTAVLETGYHCGPLCGNGELWVLRRAPGREWTVLWREGTWVE